MDEKKSLRSQEWFGKIDTLGFTHRSWTKNQGYPDHMFDGRPVIGICNTWSDLTPCNAHLRIIAEMVKFGSVASFNPALPSMNEIFIRVVEANATPKS